MIPPVLAVRTPGAGVNHEFETSTSSVSPALLRSHGDDRVRHRSHPGQVAIRRGLSDKPGGPREHRRKNRCSRRSILYTWIYNHTRLSVLVAILFRFMINFVRMLVEGVASVEWTRTGLAAAVALLVIALRGSGTSGRSPGRE
jgi:hypothetical protein